MFQKEACVETIAEALDAEKKGASRIEFCSRLDVDGLTPDLAIVKSLLKQISIPVMVMVRPRAGNFEYNDAEFHQMCEEVNQFKKIGVKGVVFGINNGDNIDLERTAKLVELANPLEVCFHKAIDELSDIISAVEQLSKIKGITRILTSGGHATAKEGVPLLKRMMLAARPNISIMPAGKVRPENLHELHQLLNAKEYHGRGIVG